MLGWAFLRVRQGTHSTLAHVVAIFNIIERTQNTKKVNKYVCVITYYYINWLSIDCIINS